MSIDVTMSDISMAPEAVISVPDVTAPAIAVVDYHKGNLRSVERGLADAGAKPFVTDDPEAIASAQALVLPGVGSFGDAMAYLNESGQAQAIHAALDHGAAFLGICLGLQLLFERGNETDDGSWAEGLGVLPGSATRLESTRLKVPHVGWDQLDLTPLGQTCPLFEGVAQSANVYFTHSFALADDVPTSVITAYTHYTRSFASAVWDGTKVFGVQFHPEKSSGTGLHILRNFVRIAAGV